MEYVPGDTVAGAKPKRPLWTLLVIPLIAFLLGIAAMGWLLSRWERGAELLGIAPTPAAQAAAAPPQVQVESAPAPVLAPAPADGRILVDPEMTRRVNVLEQRLAELDVQSRAAVGNADRAEGMLVAFAARRALDRGVALGYLEGLLRQRFGGTQPQAVGIVITAAREPVTLQQLQDGLKEVSPQLSAGGTEQTWWTAFRSEFSDLIRIRKEGTPSTIPSERLARATRALDAGLAEVALAEVLRLPGASQAGDWVAKARRYVSARRALDAVETAALLETRSAAAAGAPPARPVAQVPPGRPL
ncbi:MAG TPA: hypothetical protein VGC35_11705 [Allosphingosinicella sp.]|jgi:hypothetical protein